MSAPDLPAQGGRRGRFRRVLRSIGQRWAIVIPLLGLLTFTGMVSSTGAAPRLWQRVVVYGLAAIHAAIVLWRPTYVPTKTPAPDKTAGALDWLGVWRAARITVPAVVVGVVISTSLRAIEGRSAGGLTLWRLVRSL